MEPIAPPTEPVEMFDDVDEPGWPRVIGIISLIYAILGLVCWMGYIGMTMASGPLMRMGGMEVDMPTQILVLAGVQSVVMLFVGIFLLVGSINLLRRRRSGPATIKVWVVLRLVVLLLAFGAMFMTMPANIKMQQDIAQAQRDMISKQGGDPEQIPSKTDADMHKEVLLMGISFSLVQLVWPVFLGIWFSRRPIADQVRAWD